jgi:mRNA-degrading endonuclease RelE of RelBE toxin-antitoxin system
VDTDHPFHEQESASIDAGVTQLASGQVVFQPPYTASRTVLDLWGTLQGETAAKRQRELLNLLPARRYPDFLYRRQQPPRVRRTWYLGFTHEFCKAIQNIDRKLLGCVLQALGYISTTPTVRMGDTVNALSGDCEALWRYRIGDYRLIYRPDTDNARVVLITVVSRGAAYA